MARYWKPSKSFIARDRARGDRYEQNLKDAQRSVVADYPTDCQDAIIEAAHLHMNACEELELAKCYYYIRDNGVWVWKHEYAAEWYEKKKAEALSIYQEYLEAKERISATYGIHSDYVAELVKSVCKAFDSVEF